MRIELVFLMNFLLALLSILASIVLMLSPDRGLWNKIVGTLTFIFKNPNRWEAIIGILSMAALFAIAGTALSSLPE